MTAQGKEICRVLAAAGLRKRGHGAQTVTYEDGETRVDWQGEDQKEGLSRCAAALRAAGWHVKQEPAWVCLMVTRQPSLNLAPVEARVLEFASPGKAEQP